MRRARICGTSRYESGTSRFSYDRQMIEQVIALKDEADVLLVQRARSFAFERCTAGRRRKYSPVQSLSCMPMMCSSVDLPAPDGPMIETNSPAVMSMATRRRTHVRLAPCAYDFSRLRRAISAVGSSGSVSGAGAAAGREKKAMSEDLTEKRDALVRRQGRGRVVTHASKGRAATPTALDTRQAFGV